MKTDVILTSYNRVAWLRRAIESVLSQEDADFHLWVIDDDSDQPTLDVLADYDGHPNCTVILNHGVLEAERYTTPRYAVNINVVLNSSFNPLITYLTCDSYFLPGRLKVMGEFMETHEYAAACFGIQRMEHQDGEFIGFRGSDSEAVHHPLHGLDHNQVMHRRDVLAKTGLWPTDPELIRCGDGVFFSRIAELCGPFYPVGVVTDCMVYHDRALTEVLKSGEVPSGCLEGSKRAKL